MEMSSFRNQPADFADERVEGLQLAGIGVKAKPVAGEGDRVVYVARGS